MDRGVELQDRLAGVFPETAPRAAKDAPNCDSNDGGLPAEKTPDIRQFSTMCGHGVVAPNLIRDSIRKVKSGRQTPWEASLTLTGPCACGIYNPYRSVEFLKEKAPLHTITRW